MADVSVAAEKYVDPAVSTTLIVGDHAAIADSLASSTLGDLEVLPATVD